MKRNLILITCITVGLVLLLVLGSVFQIGDRLARVSPVAEYIFYGIMLALLTAFVAVPLIRVWRAPEMPSLTAEDVSDPAVLGRLGRKLASNCGYIKDGETRSTHRKDLSRELALASGDAEALRAVIDRELVLRVKGDRDLGVMGIDRRIREWSRTVFMVTAISQNSKFDSLSVIAINWKMIEDIVLSSGFRPGRHQMFKLYVRVLATSLISLMAADAIGDLVPGFEPADAAGDLADVGGDLDASDLADADMVNEGGSKFLDSIRRLRLPDFVLGSALDGALNALLTLRIGYVTKSYILKGSKALSDKKMRKAVKRSAIKDAYLTLPAIISDSANVLGKGVAGKLIRIFTRKAAAEATA